MNDKIKIILEDIYLLDPKLREKKEHLTRAVEEMLKNRPDIKIDENFKRELLNKVLEKSENLKINKNFNFMNMFKNLKLSQMAGALAVLALVLTPAVYWFNSNSPQIALKYSEKPGFKVASIGKNGFGFLGDSNSASPAGEKTASLAAPMLDARDSATISVAPMPVGKGIGGGGGMAISEQRVGGMPYYYEPTFYKYVYNGELVFPEENSLPVLKRNLGAANVGSSSGILSAFSLNLMNLGVFGDSKAQYITLSQEKENGYNISIDVKNESVSIGRNWSSREKGDCNGDVCTLSAVRLEEKDMPENSEIISVAEKFLREANVDISFYGRPYIRDDWRPRLLVAEDKANFYFPETVSVVFPFSFDGKEVYEQYGGEPDGLTVNVDVKNKMVADVYNLRTQNYLSSDYEIVKDSSTILKIAEQGGTGMYVPENPAKVVEIKLGEPKIVLARIWKHNQNISEEFLVPALMFSTINPPEEMYYKKNVIVPLVKEMLGEQNSLPRPVPMPLIEPATASAVVEVKTETSANGAVAPEMAPEPPAVN